jgi:hypothetical protein
MSWPTAAFGARSVKMGCIKRGGEQIGKGKGVDAEAIEKIKKRIII